jgi:hypothetical protein
VLFLELLQILKIFWPRNNDILTLVAIYVGSFLMALRKDT